MLSHVRLCSSMDCSPPVSSGRGILPAITLEQVAVYSSRGSSQPREGTSVFCVSCVAGGFFTAEPLGKSQQLGAIRKMTFGDYSSYY